MSRLSRWLMFLCLGLAGCGQEATSSGDNTPPKKTPETKKFACCCEVDVNSLLFNQQTGGTPAAGSLTMLGGTASRNPVNLVDKNLPIDWSVEEGKFKNVKWVAQHGNRGYGQPVVAGGKVYVSTTNRYPRDPKIKGHKAVIMCFRETDGAFLWQTVHEMPPPEVDDQAKEDGMCSIPAVEGNRLYFVTPGCQVVCADTADGKTIWSFDMMKKLEVFPCIINACSPLVVGDLLFVVTANGINPDNKVQTPKAPSFAAFDKKTGDLKWHSNLPGNDIIHGQWGNPVYAEHDGKGQVIFPGGDGWLYSLESQTGKLIWKFQCNPQTPGEKVDPAKRNYLLATPVVHGSRVYVGIGNAPETGMGNRVGHFWCIDITKKGNVSQVPNQLDPKAPQNKDSALVWHFGGIIEPRPKLGRSVKIGPTLSSAAVHDGLVYISDENGYLNCLDAATGQRYWEHDLLSSVWGSPYYVDGKIYLAVFDREILVFAHGKEKKKLAQIEMEETLHSTPVVANGVLYVTTQSKLYAIAPAK